MKEYSDVEYKKICDRWTKLCVSGSVSSVSGVRVGGTLTSDEWLDIYSEWNNLEGYGYGGYSGYITGMNYGEIYIQSPTVQFRYKGFVLALLDAEEIKKKVVLLQEALDV